jgi:hypothetical protein
MMIVWLMDFAGKIRVIWTLADVNVGTEITVLFAEIRAGISLEDNELGSRQSLRKLAGYVEVDKD